MSHQLTAAVIARDEEDQIGPCLAALAWADERLVLVDAATRDHTFERAQQAGARVERRPFLDFATQRNAALELARTPWVLFVDADERVTPALRAEVVHVLAQPDGRVGFWIPRRNHMLGRVLRGGGWFPDYQLRLLRRGAAHYQWSSIVHEVASLAGPSGWLAEPLDHLSHRTLADFTRKQERYCGLAARRWSAEHGRPRVRALVGQPIREFWRRYVTLAGYRDGPVGLELSLVCAWYTGRAVWRARSLSFPPEPPPAARPRS
ncbi:MAG: glycosyltransferase family 2 protein [Chloroflexi bacterium]|nr:glycosyltransferase family 2 protein [Chloroflexota bacterium]